MSFGFLKPSEPRCGSGGRFSLCSTKRKGRQSGGLSRDRLRLQSRLDLKTPSLQKRLRDVLGILVLTRPLPQTGGAQILVGQELKFLYCLLERRNYGNYRSDRLR